jgi:hypothetical protein
MKTISVRSSAQRGSLLIVAMILSAVIGISLVSYLQLSRTALSLSNRGVYQNAAINLAEQGLEEAMYAINQSVTNSSYTWGGWNTIDTRHKQQKWENVNLSQGATGEFRVHVYNFEGTPAPKIVARALITLGGGNSPPIEKWLEVQLQKTSKFANGLVAKTSITFSGSNAAVDSWNSDPNGDGSVIQAYDPSLRNDNGTVGSLSVSTSAVVVQNADVWGFVSTGGTDPTTFVGSSGSILGADSTDDGTWAKSNVDPARVSTTFSANFEEINTPSTSAIINLGTINSTRTLPRETDVAAGLAVGGVYYYDANSISLSGTSVVTIAGNVVLRLSGGVSITGEGGISIGAASSLALYTPGTVSIAGKGILNGVDANGDGTLSTAELGRPINFQLWGTETSGAQSISIAGEGQFSGIIYAPNGDVSIHGNGAVNGSVMANNITMGGDALFHYDESLANFDSGNPYRVGRWKELTTAADRAVYAAALDF